MKKISSLVLLAALGSTSQAAVVYDTTTGQVSPTYYTGTGRFLTGDNFFLADPGAGYHWRITDLSFVAYSNAAGLSTQSLAISLFNGVGVSSVATDPAFSGLAGTINTGINATATGAGSGFIFSLTNLKIDLAESALLPSTGYGIQFNYGANTSGTNAFSAGYTNSGSVATGSGYSNGFFLDTPGSGVLKNNNFVNFTGWTKGNIQFKLTAQAVPEPGSMAVLGLGAAALLRRRKKA